MRGLSNLSVCAGGLDGLQVGDTEGRVAMVERKRGENFFGAREVGVDEDDDLSALLDNEDMLQVLRCQDQLSLRLAESVDSSSEEAGGLETYVPSTLVCFYSNM